MPTGSCDQPRIPVPTGDASIFPPRTQSPSPSSLTTVDQPLPPAPPRRVQAHAQGPVRVINIPSSQAVQFDVNHYNHLLIAHRHEEAALHERAVAGQRQFYRFGLLVLLALLFIPMGYIVKGITRSEANAMNVLQIMAVFVVEAVRVFPWI
ncbi:hypothetical protein K440DRAFT_658612 [Wilcoxina mikolae CBS 423.85]|nr:hypothetical protein K440DRAFT_658612 [Wilcoxina mikolae CBS 423.85]